MDGILYTLLILDFSLGRELQATKRFLQVLLFSSSASMEFTNVYYGNIKYI